MKIGIVYQKFVSTGGLEGYLFSLARALRDAGHELLVLTGQTDGQTRALGLEVKEVELPRSKTRALLAFERAALTLGAELPVDVTLGFGRTTQQDLHRAGGGCHASYVPLLHPLKRIGFKTRLELALEKDLYTSGRTRHFVVNSELVRDQLIEHYGVAAEKFTVIHTAVDSSYFKPDLAARARFREEHGIDSEAPVCLFVSRSHRRKGLPALLRAWPEVRAKTGAQLWVAGPPIERFIKSIPASDRASIVHFPESTAIAALYQSANLFVHPTLYDACANTVLQSMACGLPGVISPADGARQFVDHGNNGWLLGDPAEPDDIAATVSAALGSDLAAIAEAARSRVLPLTWDAHVNTWEQTISQLENI